MKEVILACITGLLFFALLIGSMVIDNQIKHKCTVSGMMAGYDASEIRAICNVK